MAGRKITASIARKEQDEDLALLVAAELITPEHANYIRRQLTHVATQPRQAEVGRTTRMTWQSEDITWVKEV